MTDLKEIPSWDMILELSKCKAVNYFTIPCVPRETDATKQYLDEVVVYIVGS